MTVLCFKTCLIHALKFHILINTIELLDEPIPGLGVWGEQRFAVPFSQYALLKYYTAVLIQAAVS